MTYKVYDEDHEEWFEYRMEVSGSDTLFYTNGMYMDTWKDTVLTREEFERNWEGSKIIKVA